MSAVLAMIFDFVDVTPNPERDRVRVKLPREGRPEISPPSAEHVQAAYRLLATRYKSRRVRSQPRPSDNGVFSAVS
jgi:hypothetical protein